MSTLSKIRTKVRRLTGRPSENQITTSQVDDYINDFILYDFPENIQLKMLERVLEFMTEANVDTYDIKTLTTYYNGSNQNIDNVYMTFKPPAYVNGYQIFWSQSNEEFYNYYPKIAKFDTSVTGNGTGGPYTFTLDSTPILQNEVSIGVIDVNGDTYKIVDVPVSRTSGTWLEVNTNTTVTGSINYITGVGSITLLNSIPTGNVFNIAYVPYSAGRPQGILFYGHTFTLRPVPDASYKVTMNARIIPTKLINENDHPDLDQWWQYIAYGASKKIFEDTQDMEGASQLIAGFKEQERLVLRRTIIQQTIQRTPTIYSETEQNSRNNFYFF
jgi:hypothetical protein